MTTSVPYFGRATRFLAFLSLLSCAQGSLAGPLTPPPGPVASTGKTIAEVEPRIAVNATNTPGDNDATPSLFKVTAPGSYYLTANISAVSARSGIEIASGGVTLDLNGFSIAGFGGHTGIIVTNTAVSRIVIRNGHVVNFLQGGIDANVAGVEIDHVSVETCGVLGIRAGDRAHIANCSVSDCHTNAVGIQAGAASIVQDCIASGSAAAGIAVGLSSLLSNSSSSLNGATGIRTSSGSTVTNCSASENTGGGIDVGRGSIVSHCSARDNTGNGIVADTGATISDCSAFYNDGVGISAYSGCTVSDCTALGSTLDGIFVHDNCNVRGNTCSTNGNGGDGAGIRTNSTDNRIEGNRCTGSDRGIDVDGVGNIIIKNTCTGNTINWTIVAGNSFLIVQATVTSSNFSGNAGGGGQGSTDPNANFTY